MFITTALKNCERAVEDKPDVLQEVEAEDAIATVNEADTGLIDDDPEVTAKAIRRQKKKKGKGATSFNFLDNDIFDLVKYNQEATVNDTIWTEIDGNKTTRSPQSRRN